jgi:hypothetical protein
MLFPPKDIFVIGDGKDPLIVNVVPAAAVVGDKELTKESWLLGAGVGAGVGPGVGVIGAEYVNEVNVTASPGPSKEPATGLCENTYPPEKPE